MPQHFQTCLGAVVLTITSLTQCYFQGLPGKRKSPASLGVVLHNLKNVLVHFSAAYQSPLDTGLKPGGLVDLWLSITELHSAVHSSHNVTQKLVSALGKQEKLISMLQRKLGATTKSKGNAYKKQNARFRASTIYDGNGNRFLKCPQESLAKKIRTHTNCADLTQHTGSLRSPHVLQECNPQSSIKPSIMSPSRTAVGTTSANLPASVKILVPHTPPADPMENLADLMARMQLSDSALQATDANTQTNLDIGKPQEVVCTKDKPKKSSKLIKPETFTMTQSSKLEDVSKTLSMGLKADSKTQVTRLKDTLPAKTAQKKPQSVPKTDSVSETLESDTVTSLVKGSKKTKKMEVQTVDHRPGWDLKDIVPVKLNLGPVKFNFNLPTVSCTNKDKVAVVLPSLSGEGKAIHKIVSNMPNQHLVTKQAAQSKTELQEISAQDCENTKGSLDKDLHPGCDLKAQVMLNLGNVKFNFTLPNAAFAKTLKANLIQSDQEGMKLKGARGSVVGTARPRMQWA